MRDCFDEFDFQRKCVYINLFYSRIKKLKSVNKANCSFRLSFILFIFARVIGTRGRLGRNVLVIRA